MSTPRTDAALCAHYPEPEIVPDWEPVIDDLVKCSRQLETELASALATITRLQAELNAFSRACAPVVEWVGSVDAGKPIGVIDPRFRAIADAYNARTLG